MDEPQIKPSVRYSPKRTDGSLSLKKKISAVLSSCRICLSSVFEPACLTGCGHRFCEKCLNTYWHVNDKPASIVCPLCRGETSDVAFVLKEGPSSTTEFRKTFGVPVETNPTLKPALCLKIMLIPALYWIANWLEAPVMQLIEYFWSATPELTETDVILLK